MPSSKLYLIRRLFVYWPAKLSLGAVLTIVFCAGYFGIQRHPLWPPVQLGLTTMDRAVPFSPGWVWVYQSIYLLLPAAWLCETTDQLRRYTIGFVSLMLAGFSCFLLWPVSGPRPPAMPDDSMYRVLVQYDTTLNSFPSLHMALAAYSACVAVAVTSGGLRRGLLLLLPPWVALIGYSTLAIKQHYWVDLPPGIALGWLAHAIAWRNPQSQGADMTVRTKLLPALILSLALPVLALAAEPAAQAAGGDPAAELDQLRVAIKEAYNRGDAEGMARYLHPDAVIVFPDGSVLKGRDALREYYHRMLRAPGHRVNSYSADPVIESRTVHNDVGLSYGYMNDQYVLDDGMSFGLNSRFTVTVFKTPDGPPETGGWMIRSFHSSTDAFDNPILTLVTRRVFLLAGLGGLTIGALLGLAAGVFWFRRKK